MHNWIRHEPIDATLQRLARCGYDSIELSGDPQTYDLSALKAKLKAYGLSCWGVVSVMTPGRDLIHADPYMRDATVRYMKDCIRMAAELDGQIFCTVPSTVGKMLPMAAPEDEWRWAVEGLQEVEAFARSEGVRLGVEPINRFETYFLNRQDQALRLAQDVGGTCGVILDTFHLNIEEPDLIAAIRDTGAYLIDFHVADNNRYPPGQGALPWRQLIATLKETGYDGALTVEFMLPPDPTPLAAPADDDDAQAITSDQFIRAHAGGALSESHYLRLTQASADFLRPLMS